MPNIKTPIIEGYLEDSSDERKARVIKGRIEKTTLGEIAEFIVEVYEPRSAPYLHVKVAMGVVQQLFLPINLQSIARAIENDSQCKKLRISQVEIDEVRWRVWHECALAVVVVRGVGCVLTAWLGVPLVGNDAALLHLL